MTINTIFNRALKAEQELIAWRSAFQSVTPGGSEFCDPKAVRAWADMLKTDLFNAKKQAVLAERRAIKAEKERDAIEAQTASLTERAVVAEREREREKAAALGLVQGHALVVSQLEARVATLIEALGAVDRVILCAARAIETGQIADKEPDKHNAPDYIEEEPRYD